MVATNNNRTVSNQVTVQVLKAAAGRDKTGSVLRITAATHRNRKTVFAVRTIETGREIQLRLEKQYHVNHICIKRVDSEYSQPGFVMVDLNEALSDPETSIVICTHEALVRFQRWPEYHGMFALNIDELPEALEAEYAVFGVKAARGISEKYGITADSSDDGSNEEALKLIESINGNPLIFQSYAAELFEEDSTSSDDKTWGNGVLNLFRVAKDADCNHIHATTYTDTGVIKVCVSAIKRSRVFEILTHFNSVTLTTMLFDDHIFKRVGIASGINFIDFNWDHQNKPFDNSSNVTLVVMTDMNKLASRSQMDKVDADNNSLFKRAIRKLVTLQSFQPENAAETSKRNQIMLYTNETRKNEIRQMKLSDRFEFLPYCTHGLRNWETENLFAAFLTFQWREAYNVVGKRFAEDLGISFEILKEEYNFTQMVEPIAQAVTRGVVRNHSVKDVKSWIAVPDLYTAKVLKSRLFHDAIIDTDHMVSTADNVGNKPNGRPATWKAVAEKEICVLPKDAQWLYKNIDKISQYFSRPMDCTSTLDIFMMTHYLNIHEPHRTMYVAQLE